MLSGETAAGKYPVEAVQTMANIVVDTEADIDYRKRFRQRRGVEHLSVADAISHSACLTAIDIEASAIITVTRSGASARLLSKYRPEQPILSCVTDAHAARQLSLSWGVYPLVMPLLQSTDELLKKSEEMCVNAGFIKSGELVVTTAGLPVGESGTTNMVKVHLVGEPLANGLGIGKGKASGRVCVCRDEEEVEDKFKEGDVLVMQSTSNAILKHIISAAAVITEESGANSHAAIVGLTLNKPVIVGVAGAVKTLKDGMKVAVDAERGIIQKLEK
jgi:pyruvate kinase